MPYRESATSGWLQQRVVWVKTWSRWGMSHADISGRRFQAEIRAMQRPWGTAMPGRFGAHGKGRRGWSRVRKAVSRGVRAGRGQDRIFRTCGLVGKTLAFPLSEVGATEGSERGGMSPDSGVHRHRWLGGGRLLGTDGGGQGRRPGQMRLHRSRRTRMGGSRRGGKWKTVVLSRMRSYIPGKSPHKTQVFYRETKPHNNCSFGQLLTDRPTEAVPTSRSRDKPDRELRAILETPANSPPFSLPLSEVFFF